GKNATGTVWAGDFVFYGRGGNWAGQDWNTSVGVPQGFYYWLPPNGGNDGLLSNGFENTVVTNTAAHSGSYSLEFNMPFNRAPHDGYVGTQRFMLDGSGPTPRVALKNAGGKTVQAVAGDILRITVWIKASNLVPDSAALYPGTWAVGFTPLWFTGTGSNYGYNPVGPSNDYTFTFPATTAFDWTPYSLDITVPTGVNARALEVRLHVYSRFTGTIYFDDLSIEDIGSTTGVKNSLVPLTFDLANNYPNPFNPTTTIHYSVPNTAKISLAIYNVLGQEVRMLVDGNISAGYHDVVWDGKDNHGNTVQSGVFFYRLETGSMAIVKKMLLIK
ncbi:MAG TPA: FlgD immunoglobulin-like domain containing protein, partial [Bacteroidota bacterium]|nr:FlgD immunoglobulin-like domain containing protein [Bacteroidota bacterium]